MESIPSCAVTNHEPGLRAHAFMNHASYAAEESHRGHALARQVGDSFGHLDEQIKLMSSERQYELPVNISNEESPSAKMSAAVVTEPASTICSGDAYPGVPTYPEVRVRRSPAPSNTGPELCTRRRVSQCRSRAPFASTDPSVFHERNTFSGLRSR